MDQTVKQPFLPRIFGLALLLCGVLVVYLATVQSLLARWNQTGSEYGHGLLLVGVIVWLIYRQRQALRHAAITPCYWALLPAMLCSVLWSAGYITQVNLVQQFALPGVVFFSVTALMGIAVARIIWFPLSLIVLALPVWNVLQPTLQYLAVTACAFIFSTLSIPVHISGNSISVTSGTFQVAAGCSGLNLFLAASVLGILFAHLNFARHRDQLIVVLLALLVGIVCNWIRITSIIAIAQFSDNIQHPIVQDHGWLGWTWFAVLFAAYLFFVNRLPFANKHIASTPNSVQQQTQRQTPRRISIAALAACMFGVYSAPLLSMYLLNSNGTHNMPIVSPTTLFDYSAVAINDTTTWQPNFHAASSELHLRVAASPSPFDFHLYFYAAQSQAAELIHFDNTIADAKNWHVVQYLPQHSNAANSWWQDVVVKSDDANNRQTLLIRYWYSIAGSNTTNSASAKLLQLKGFIQNRTDASLIAINAKCTDAGCNDAQQQFDEITKTAVSEADRLITSLLMKN